MLCIFYCNKNNRWEECSSNVDCPILFPFLWVLFIFCAHLCLSSYLPELVKGVVIWAILGWARLGLTQTSGQSPRWRSEGRTAQKFRGLLGSVGRTQLPGRNRLLQASRPSGLEATEIEVLLWEGVHRTPRSGLWGLVLPQSGPQLD